MRIAAGAVLAALLLGLPAAAQDLSLAPRANAELRQICAADRARLWGVDLCGPLLVVSPQTRFAWASQPDGLNFLQPNGAGWTGALPTSLPLTGEPIEWAGTRWMVLPAPLPEDVTERRVLVAGAAWRRVQNLLGLTAAAGDCAHLDTQRGRYFLRLEMRALATALRSRGNARQFAAREALLFRAARLAEIPGAATQEAALDRDAGLAAYTGVMLGAGDNSALFAARRLDAYDEHGDYARTYAQATGPAYGLLLDSSAPGWRARIGAYTPAAILAAAVRATELDPARLQAATERYGGREIAQQERARAGG